MRGTERKRGRVRWIEGRNRDKRKNEFWEETEKEGEEVKEGKEKREDRNGGKRRQERENTERRKKEREEESEGRRELITCSHDKMLPHKWKSHICLTVFVQSCCQSPYLNYFPSQS